MPRVSLDNIAPVSGFLSGPNPRRQTSFYYAAALAVSVWSITPLAWLTVAGRIYRKGTPFSLPSQSTLARVWYVMSLLEIPFSIYLAYLIRSVRKEASLPSIKLEQLQELLTRTFCVGLSPKEPKTCILRNDKTVSALPEDAQALCGLAAMQDKFNVDPQDAAQRKERLRTWFFYAQIKDIRVDNVREWLAGAFAGRRLSEITDDKEVVSLIDEGLEIVKLRLGWHDIQPGYNPEVRTIRLTLDPVRIMHRPLLYYVVTNGVSFSVIAWLLIRHGFRIENSGKCSFLVKKPVEGGSKDDKSLPIAFCHGLGIGIGQYMTLLNSLARHRDGVVIAIQPHISTGIYSRFFLNPPSKDEQAQATVDILKRNNFTRCTTLSHSNGTMVLGWLLRTAPELFVRNVLVDPVSFCLWEGSVCYSFVYRPWSSGIEVLLGYFVARELGTAHTIGRKFIWFDMCLWAEELPSWKPEDLHIIFAECDALVDVPGSVHYLREAGIGEECISVMHKYQHGQALMHNSDGMQLALKNAGLRV